MHCQLSIAIPVFNQDVCSLVTDLMRMSGGYDVEILVFDDGSAKEWKLMNRALGDHEIVHYEEMPENLGRAAIRNRLAEAAKAEHILFLDGDSVMITGDFIGNYLRQVADTPEAVLCGGRNYSNQCPNPGLSLHWYYGTERESKPASTRAGSPWHAFHSNNFVIPRRVWKKVPFDEQLRGYGHEDTLLGFELMQNDIPVIHLENPTEHGLLETNEEFMAKTRQAINNLKLIYERHDAEFIAWYRMLRTYRTLRNTGLYLFPSLLYKLAHKSWENSLTKRAKPPLRIFDWYRLGYLCSL